MKAMLWFWFLMQMASAAEQEHAESKNNGHDDLRRANGEQVRVDHGYLDVEDRHTNIKGDENQRRHFELSRALDYKPVHTKTQSRNNMYRKHQQRLRMRYRNISQIFLQQDANVSAKPYKEGLPNDALQESKDQLFQYNTHDPIIQKQTSVSTTTSNKKDISTISNYFTQNHATRDEVTSFSSSLKRSFSELSNNGIRDPFKIHVDSFLKWTEQYNNKQQTRKEQHKPRITQKPAEHWIKNSQTKLTPRFLTNRATSQKDKDVGLHIKNKSTSSTHVYPVQKMYNNQDKQMRLEKDNLRDLTSNYRNNRLSRYVSKRVKRTSDVHSRSKRTKTSKSTGMDTFKVNDKVDKGKQIKGDELLDESRHDEMQPLMFGMFATVQELVRTVKELYMQHTFDRQRLQSMEQHYQHKINYLEMALMNVTETTNHLKNCESDLKNLDLEFEDTKKEVGIIKSKQQGNIKKLSEATGTSNKLSKKVQRLSRICNQRMKSVIQEVNSETETVLNIIKDVEEDREQMKDEIRNLQISMKDIQENTRNRDNKLKIIGSIRSADLDASKINDLLKYLRVDMQDIHVQNKRAKANFFWLDPETNHRNQHEEARSEDKSQFRQISRLILVLEMDEDIGDGNITDNSEQQKVEDFDPNIQSARNFLEKVVSEKNHLVFSSKGVDNNHDTHTIESVIDNVAENENHLNPTVTTIEASLDELHVNILPNPTTPSLASSLCCPEQHHFHKRPHQHERGSTYGSSPVISESLEHPVGDRVNTIITISTDSSSKNKLSISNSVWLSTTYNMELVLNNRESLSNPTYILPSIINPITNILYMASGEDTKLTAVLEPLFAVESSHLASSAIEATPVFHQSTVLDNLYPSYVISDHVLSTRSHLQETESLTHWPQVIKNDSIAATSDSTIQISSENNWVVIEKPGLQPNDLIKTRTGLSGMFVQHSDSVVSTLDNSNPALGIKDFVDKEYSKSLHSSKISTMNTLQLRNGIANILTSTQILELSEEIVPVLDGPFLTETPPSVTINLLDLTPTSHESGGVSSIHRVNHETSTFKADTVIRSDKNVSEPIKTTVAPKSQENSQLSSMTETNNRKFNLSEAEHLEANSGGSLIITEQHFGYIRGLEERIKILESATLEKATARIIHEEKDFTSKELHETSEVNKNHQTNFQSPTPDIKLLHEYSQNIMFNLTQQNLQTGTESQMLEKKHLQIFIQKLESDLKQDFQTYVKNQTSELKHDLQTYVINQTADMREKLNEHMSYALNEHMSYALNEHMSYALNQTSILREEMNRNAGDIKTMQAVADKTLKMVDELSGQSRMLREKEMIHGPAESVSKLEDRVRQVRLKGDRWFKSLQGHVIRLNNTVQDLREQVDHMSGTNADQLARIDRNIVRVQGSVKVTDRSVNLLTSKVTQLQSLDSQIDLLQKEMSNMLLLVPQDCHDYFLRGFRETGIYVIKHRNMNHTVRVFCLMEVKNRATINTNCCCDCDGRNIDDEGNGNISLNFKHKGGKDYIISDENVNNGLSECDGGWTVIQKRTIGKVNFTRSWEEYVNGFGFVEDEHWMGNELIHLLCVQKDYELRVVMVDVFSKKWEVRYDMFKVAGKVDNYRINLGGYYGNVSDGMGVSNNTEFSSYDADNDVSSSHCARFNGGGWWYSHCHISNLNGPPHLGMVWYNMAWQDWILVKSSMMMIRPRK